jgi:hypothetical protein
MSFFLSNECAEYNIGSTPKELRIATQVAEVLHEHKRTIVFAVAERLIVGDSPQNSGSA